MENKLKEQLMVALSEEVEYKDFDNAYNVVKKSAVSFSLFCAKNYDPYRVINQEVVWKDFGNGVYTTDELFKIWSDEV